MATKKPVSASGSQVSYRADRAVPSHSDGCHRCYGLPHIKCREGDSRGDRFGPKDATKRKRVNRVARLKQCKLDARREQWLTQGHNSQGNQQKQGKLQFPRTEEKRIASENDKISVAIPPEEGSEAHLRDALLINHFLTKQKFKSNDGVLNFSEIHSINRSVESQSKFTSAPKIGTSERSVSLRECPPVDIPESLLDDTQSEQRPNDSRRSYDVEIREETSHREICCEPFCKIPHSMKYCVTNARQQKRDPPFILEMNFQNLKSYDSGDEASGAELDREGVVWTPVCCVDQLLRASGSCSSTQTGCNSDNLSQPLEAEDDWEATADALYNPTSPRTKETIESCRAEENFASQHGEFNSSVGNRHLMPEYKSKIEGSGIHHRSVGGRAWRPDDTSRPPTLPSLSKTLYGPKESDTSLYTELDESRNMWGPPPLPSYCPICTEELDLTDSSFFPCACGFRLCLFCYHRIFSDDGRCPGCRKTYNPDTAVKLSRTTLCLKV